MTAGADRFRAAGRRRAVLVVALPVVALLVTLAGCTGVDPQARPEVAVPTQDLQAIRTAIQELNATSAGPVADQQATLRGLIDPAKLSTLDDCPPPTTTVRFEPVYSGLRPIAGDAADPAGSWYALPVLIRVFTGDRITGTDLASMQLDVRENAAFVTPICVA